MNKDLTWKQLLVVGILTWGLAKLLTFLPTVILAAFELGGIICFVIGIIGGVKAAFLSGGKDKSQNKIEKKD